MNAPSVSLLRLNILRAFYAVVAFGIATVVWPDILWPPADMSLSGSVVHAMLGCVGVLALLGIRYPLRMLPLLIFELLWKIIWVVSYVLPWWHAGHLPEGTTGDLAQCIFGFVFIPLVLPWRYVMHHFLRDPSEPWRPARGEQQYVAR